MVCSAVVTLFPPGVFMTTMPRLVAASTSILSTTDASPANHAQVVGRRNDSRSNACPAPNNQALIQSDLLGQFLFGQSRLDGKVDIWLRLQPRHSLRGERVGNKHFM